MGFRFRKSVKILPGVRVNLGNKGVNSVSVGTRGAKVNFGKKGVRSTVGINGTGLSYSEYAPYQNKRSSKRRSAVYEDYNNDYRKVGFWLGFGIFFMPYLFVWFTLREGYSTTARVLSFGWFGLFLFSMSIR